MPPTLVRRRAGFTLIEIMVVVAIIGLLLTLVAPKFYNYLRQSQVTVTQGKMQNLKLPIQQFRNNEHKLPDSLEQLLEPSEKNMNEPYVESEEELNDAWGNRMQYQKISSSKYDVISLGADGIEGGDADDADLHSNKSDSSTGSNP